MSLVLRGERFNNFNKHSDARTYNYIKLQMIVRLAGVVLPQDKRIEIGLTAIFGIGRKLSRRILRELNINLDTKVKDLKEAEVSKLREVIEKKVKVEGELRRDIMLNIKRLKEVSCYRGVRHTKGLPVRGQRTRTNSRTVRGNVRRTMGSGRKPPAQKT